VPGATGATGPAGAPQTPSDTNPLVNATAAPGVSALYSRGDHVHPTDTSRAALTQVVRYDTAQALSANQMAQARSNIGVPGANLAINGDFRINQSGYVSAAVLAAGAYGHDQWKAGASGGDYSFTQLNSSTQITIAAGKSLIQPIEDIRVTSNAYVLTWTGTAQARAGVNTLAPSGAYAANPLLITGQTVGTVMSVEFNTGTLGTVKLEAGAVATPFVVPDYPSELALCMRYYRRTTGEPGTEPAHYGYGDSGASIGTTFMMPVPMRATPTVATTGTWVLTGTATQPILNGANASSYSLYVTANATGRVSFQPNNSGRVSFNARL
jgi:hypothetical protein